MRKGFLTSLLFLFAAAPGTARAQQLDDRPDAVPLGYRFYGRVDYLLGWTEKDRPLPALSPTPHPVNALIPTATDFEPLLRHGSRGVLGCWLDDGQRFGLELGGFWVDNREPDGGGSLGGEALRTEFVNHLWGAEAQLRCELVRGTWMHFDLLTGLRHLSLDESLHLLQRDPAQTVTSDRFATRNRFYGGEFGGEMELHHGKWFIDLWGKVALGTNCESYHLNGTTLSGGRATPGGLLVSGAMAGNYRRDEFAVVPEVGVNLGYHFGDHLRLTVGYTFTYLSEAARPGEQANALLLAPQLQSSDFWVQGLNFGFEFRF